jgi:hypothetical protein
MFSKSTVIVVLRKQRQTIESLTQYNRRLFHELSLHQAAPRSVDHKLGLDREQAALEEIRLIGAQISRAEESGRQLDDAIETVRKRVITRRPNSSSIRHDTENLENRLHNCLTKFNDLATLNSTLREEVETLRREKQHFVTLEKGLIEDIAKLKRSGSNMMEQIKASYAARDKAVLELNSLRHAADREHFDFEAQLRELNSLIEKDVEVHRYSHAEQPPVVETAVKQPAALEEPTSANLGDLQREAEKLEWMLERVKESTGMASVEEFVALFSGKEATNYSLMTRVEFLTSEVRKLQTRINHQHSEFLRLQPAVPLALTSSSESELDRWETKISVKKKLLQKITQLIHSIFLKTVDELSSNRTTFSDIAESESDETVLSYLGRLHANLTRYLRPSVVAPKPLVRRGTLHVPSLPSSIRLDDLDEDELGTCRILSREEIVKSLSRSRLNSAASTRPSTTHTKSRKSLK